MPSRSPTTIAPSFARDFLKQCLRCADRILNLVPARFYFRVADSSPQSQQSQVPISPLRSRAAMDSSETMPGGPGGTGSDDTVQFVDEPHSMLGGEGSSTSPSGPPANVGEDGDDGVPAQDEMQVDDSVGAQATPASAPPSLELAPVPRPPVSLRSPHSIASAPSALHRIAEVPDASFSGETPAPSAEEGSTPEERLVSSAGITEAGTPPVASLPGSNELSFTAAPPQPVLTSTPTGHPLDFNRQLGMGPPGSDLANSFTMNAAGTSAGAGMTSRKPFQRTLSMPLGNRLGPLQRPQRSSQRIPNKRAVSSSSFGLSKRRESQSSVNSVQEGSSGGNGRLGGGVSQRNGADGTPSDDIALPEEQDDEEDGLSEQMDEGDDAVPFPALLADTLQLSISTLLQLISPHLLDPSHERYSASSIQVPVTSIEALLESHRALNWLCAKMDDAGSISAADVRSTADKLSAVADAARLTRNSGEEEAEDVVLVRSSMSPAQGHLAAAHEVGIPTSESSASMSITSTSRAPSSISGFSRVERSSPSTAVSSLHLPHHISSTSRANSMLNPASSPMEGPNSSYSSPKEVDFDIAELVQRAADAVSGQAAARGVDIALCPPVCTMIKNGSTSASASLEQTLGVSVRGDEGAVRFGMLHALSKVVEQCERGRTVHAALCVTELSESVAEAHASNGKGKAREAGANVQCCLHIYQKSQDGESATGSSTEKDAGVPESPVSPAGRQRKMQRALSTKFLQGICCRVTVRDVPWPQVLGDHNRTTSEADEHRSHEAGTEQGDALQYSLYYYLKRGGPLVEAAAVDLRESFSRQRYLPSVSVGREPSLSELVGFVETELRAKGRTVALHAQGESTGAKQLISMLSSWGCSVALFPLPRIQRAGAGLGNGNTVLEETGLWAGVPHEYGSSMDVSDSMSNDPNESVGSEVDALGAPMTGATQRNLRTAVALVPDGKPSLVSYPSGLQLPLLPQSSSGEGARLARGSMDTVMGLNGDEGSHFSSTDSAPFDAAVLDPVTGVPLAVTGSGQGVDRQATEETIAAGLSSQIVPFSFVIIDDDVEVLQRELLRLQSAVPMLRSALGSPVQTPGFGHQWDPLSQRKAASRSSMPSGRPALPHRSGSNAQIQRVLAEERGEAYVKAAQPPSGVPMQKVPSTADSPTYAIIHLTSLGNFRLVRDFVRSMIESTSAQQRAGVPLSLPEILVIPKPIGPRRLLTTLHTAVHKPLVDEFFVPIATSPLNPGMSSVQGGSGFLDVFGRESNLRTSHLSDPDPIPLQQALDTKMAAPLVDPTAVVPAPVREAALLQPATAEAIQEMPKVDTAQGAALNNGAQVQASAPASSVLNKGRVESSLPVPAASPGTHTPWSGASAAGKRSHPNSPLPMDALEYFNETASRMGSRAASGMLVQSADGKSAGIFFRPGDHGRSQSGSGHNRRGSTDLADSDRGSGAEYSSTSSRWPPSQQGDLQLRDLRRQSATTVQPDADAASHTSSRRRRSPSIGQPVSARPYPSGSLFSPEVGIEAVLAGSEPPVATPLGPPNRHPGPQTPWEPSSMAPRPGPAAVIAASGTPSARSPQQGSTVSPPESVMPPPPSPGESPVPKELDLPPISADARPEPSHSIDSGSSHAPRHLLHPHSSAQWPPGQQPQAVAMTPQQSTRGVKPSALPQPGLLIGAGFAAKDKKVAAPKKSLLREPVLPPIKVLIVEDNPINQRIMAKFMDKKKIKYEIATNGKDAIERWQSGGFHLILMDIQLPVMDGIEATREIRRLERSANIGILPNTPPTGHSSSRREGDWTTMPPARPAMSAFRASVIIVALTASVFNPDRVAALAAGCNDYLTKPVNHNWLEKKIIEWGSMQYILLSGFPSNNWDRWREERRLDAATVAAGPGANRQVVRDIRRGFNSGPDENARKLASKLHISRPARSGRGSPGPPVPAAAQTVPGRLVQPDLGHHGRRSEAWQNQAGCAGPRSSGSTDSSGSSIRLYTNGPAAISSDLNQPGTEAKEALPVLRETSPPVDPVVPYPTVTPSPLVQQMEPEAAGDPSLLSVTPTQMASPSPVAEEDVEKLINDGQVTKALPDGSSVQNLIG
ncbi:hypothetical protein CF319_g6783 [Tilletia indica]|nr:hypothetical protein CF319_g6783 [Tilletia indica]